MNRLRTAAFVGCTGGAGTTRLSVESAATLARAGHSAAVLDLDFATQGLAAYVPGDINPDATTLLTDEAALTDAFVDLAPDAPGRLAACPARAPFVRVAAAKTPVAAEYLDELVADILTKYDYLLLDVPPVVENQAIAGVMVADCVAAVIPPSARGVDALARERGRLADLGTRFDLIIANRASPKTAPQDADLTVPTGVLDVPDPVCLSSTATIAPAVAEVVTALFEIELPLETEPISVMDRVRDRLA